MSKFHEELPVRIAQFRQIDSNRQRLQKLLGDPVMIEALVLIGESYQPTVGALPGEAQLANFTLSLRHALQAGAHDFLRQLRNLCDEPAQAEEPPALEPLLNEGDPIPGGAPKPRRRR